MDQAENQELRRYLLGLVTGEAAEKIELRLLTDPEYADEFNIVVNQITDDYVNGVFKGEERERVEKVFFKTPQRREKLSFSLALKRAQSDHRRSSWRVLKIYVPIAAGVLLAATVGITVWKGLHS